MCIYYIYIYIESIYHICIYMFVYMHIYIYACTYTYIHEIVPHVYNVYGYYMTQNW